MSFFLAVEGNLTPEWLPRPYNGVCVVHGRRLGLGGSLLLCLESLDNAMECVVHGWDVLNKRGFVRPFRA